jgi:hypothetical protein
VGNRYVWLIETAGKIKDSDKEMDVSLLITVLLLITNKSWSLYELEFCPPSQDAGIFSTISFLSAICLAKALLALPSITLRILDLL